MLRSSSSSLLLLLLCACALLVKPARSAAAASPVKQYCQPSQPCWPNAAAWQAFNTSLSGRLIAVRPWQDPCFTEPNGFKQPQCQLVRLNYFDGKTRSSYPGSAQTDNWASCTTNAGLVGDCSLTASTTGQLTLTPVSGQVCKLGRLSPYAVDIGSPADVTTALAFAQKNNIKVVVKNTGHEYLGRSTAPDSLMLWTHNLQDITFVPNFAPGKDALRLGAGVSADSAYAAAAQNSRTITLGAYGSVGVAGGFAQGGGHGPLQPTFGLAVDNILQYTVVTADGQVRTANANTNADLFWAMRGGGGGTWGVATETVYAVHPATTVISVVYNLTMNPVLQATGTDAAKQAAIADFVAHMAKYQETWTRRGWAGYTFIQRTQLTFAQFLPSDDLVAAKQDMQDMITYITTNLNFVAIPIAALVPTPNFELWRQIFFGLGASNTPVAYSERLASRLIPTSAFDQAPAQLQLAKDVTQALWANAQNGPLSAEQQRYRAGDSLQIYSTGPRPAAWGGPSGADTGVNTAWRSSLWEVVINSAWTNLLSQPNRNYLAQQTSTAANVLRKYGTGTYFSESDVLEPNWQTAFFGDNYARLVSIKRKYDPNNVFVVYKGIGYAQQENQASFACYQQA